MIHKNAIIMYIAPVALWAWEIFPSESRLKNLAPLKKPLCVCMCVWVCNTAKVNWEFKKKLLLGMWQHVCAIQCTCNCNYYHYMYLHMHVNDELTMLLGWVFQWHWAKTQVFETTSQRKTTWRRESCHSCREKQTITKSIYSKWAWIFWSFFSKKSISSVLNNDGSYFISLKYYTNLQFHIKTT